MSQGELFDIDNRAHLDTTRVDLKNFDTAFDIGQWHVNLAVKATWAISAGSSTSERLVAAMTMT